MSTKIIDMNDGGVVIVPDFALIHAGFLPNEQGEFVGHTDFTKSTGSIFVGGVDVISLIQDLLSKGDDSVSPMVRYESEDFVGWSSLVVGCDKVTGIIIKEESSSERVFPVLAPAFADADFVYGGEVGKTKMVSAIVPLVSDKNLIPVDIAENKVVSEAFRLGKLRCLVSLFPGESVVNGVAIPKISEASGLVSFVANPLNNLFLEIGSFNKEEIIDFCRFFNTWVSSEKEFDFSECSINEKKAVAIGKIYDFNLLRYKKKNSFVC